MCTASWLIDAGSYELFFNRDEQRERLPGNPPEILDVEGMRCVAPRDGNEGGTWLGVNEAGIAIGLLNAWEEREAPSEPAKSRGQLVLGLLACATGAEVRERLDEADLSLFRGFRMAIFELDEDPWVTAWDGRRLSPEKALQPLCSSGLGAREAHAARARVLTDLAAGAGGVTRNVLEALHSSHEPERGAFSPCMHRDDARTVSVSHVMVAPDRVRFRYAPGPLCEARFGSPVELSLSARPGVRI